MQRIYGGFVRCGGRGVTRTATASDYLLPVKGGLLQVKYTTSTKKRRMQSLWVGAVASSTAFSIVATTVAACEGNDNDFQKFLEKARSSIQKSMSEKDELSKNTQQVIDSVNRFLDSGTGGQVTWGFCMGYCSGIATRKISKVGAIVMGGAFMGMQFLSFNGYIHVNYKKMERDMTNLMDINKDGKFDRNDANLIYRNLMKVLEFSIPAGSGFGAGFLLGFRKG